MFNEKESLFLFSLFLRGFYKESKVKHTRIILSKTRSTIKKKLIKNLGLAVIPILNKTVQQF